MKCNKLVSMLIFILLSLTIASAQPNMTQSTSRIELPYSVDVVNVKVPENPELSRINVYVEIKYDDLQFIKHDNGFESKYEVTMVIYDDDEFQVDGKIWKEEVLVNSFDETNAINMFSSTHNQFDLEPDKYMAVISVQDLESENTRAVKFKIELEDFSKDELMLSGIAYLNNIVFDSLGVKSISPTVSNVAKGLQSPAFAFFEIYNQTDAKTAKIKYEIDAINAKLELKDEYSIDLTGDRTLVPIELPVDSLPPDGYEFRLEVKAGKKKAKEKKNFFIRMEGLPSTAQNLEMAIKQVEYIATPSEWKALKKAPEDKKMDEFNKFWKRHDPTPGTDVNEAMDAHYGRIEFANRYFSVMQREGWRTDRGMLYVLLGPPDDIARDPYPSDMRPWEIWNYYRINRRFEFVDHTGFGDYRFYYPQSMYELQMYLR